MDPLLIPVFLALIGCTTGVVLRGMSLFSVGRQRALEEQVRLLREQLSAREARLADLERVNHHLEQQVEWHLKLLGSGPTAPPQLERG